MKNYNTAILIYRNSHIPNIEVKLDELITAIKVELLLEKM